MRRTVRFWETGSSVFCFTSATASTDSGRIANWNVGANAVKVAWSGEVGVFTAQVGSHFWARVAICLPDVLQHGQHVFIPIGHASLEWAADFAIGAVGQPQTASPIDDWKRSTRKAIIKRVADCIASIEIHQVSVGRSDETLTAFILARTRCVAQSRRTCTWK